MKAQLKGQLHIHTKLSDGRKLPDEAAKIYRDAGYDFIAFTDHWRFGEPREFEGMKILSGIEYDVGASTKEEIFHIVGIGMERDPALTKAMLAEFDGSVAKAQFVIDSINKSGGAAILAHPVWSLNRVSSVKQLHGLAGSEIYNGVSGYPWGNRAYSAPFFDAMAAEGVKLGVFAADDTHYYESDACGSATYIDAEKPIMEAVKAAETYASLGPRLEVKREGDLLRLECSPAVSIVIETGCVWIPGRVIRGDDITRAEYTIKPNDYFARFEVTDKDGKIAWSGIYML